VTGIASEAFLQCHGLTNAIIRIFVDFRG